MSAAALEPGQVSTGTPPGELDVFLSYSRHDARFVTELARGLEQLGRSVWLDADDIAPAAPWRTELGTAIEAAHAFVFVISPQSLASKECAVELQRAVELGKRLVPILHRDHDDIPPALASLQFIAIRREDELTDGLVAVQRAIDTDHDWVREHTRWGARALRWDERERADRSRLLRGDELRNAETWLASQIESVSPRPTQLQVDFIVASRHAERRRLRALAAAALTGVAIASILAVLALLSKREAVEQRDQAHSRESATAAVDQLDVDPELSILLALRAEDAARTPEAIAATRQALARSAVRLRTRPPGGPIERLAATTGPARIVASAGRRTLLSDAATASTVAVLPGAAATTFATGNRAATMADRVARIFDTASGREVDRLTAPGALYDVMLADAGRWVVASFETEAGSGVLAHQTGSAAAPIALDGGLVAASAGTPLVALGRGDAGQRLRFERLTPDGPRVVRDVEDRSQMLTAAMDPSGRRFASVELGGVMTLRDLKGGPPRFADISDGQSFLPGTRVSLAFDATGSRIAVAVKPNFSESGGGSTVAGNTTATVHDARTGTVLAVLRGHAGLINAINLSPDGRRVMTASDDGTARVWDAGTGDQLEVLRGHDGPVRACAFLANDRVATGGADGSTRIWDLQAPRPRASIAGDVLAASESGRFIAAADHDGATSVRDVTTGRGVSWRRPAGDVETLRVADDGATVAVEAPFGKTTTWSVAGRTRVGSVSASIIGPSSARGLVLVDWPGRTQVVDGRSPRRRVKLRTGIDQTHAGAFSPDGRLVLTLGGDVKTTAGDGLPRIWSTRTGRLLKTLGVEARIYAAAFSPDSRRVATGGEDGLIGVWDLRDDNPKPKPALTLRPRAGRVLSLRYDRAGTSLAAAVRGTRAFVWNLGDARSPIVLSGHDDDVTGARFSPDGTLVVTSSADGQARVWDRSTGRLLLGLPDTGEAASFTDDGRSLIVSDGSSLRVIACEVCGTADAVVARARERAARSGRKLTAGERRTYLHEG